MRRFFSIGECLIDFMPDRTGSLSDCHIFHKNAGGAPANVAATLAKKGAKSYFIGKFGNDSFGDFLIDTLNLYGVNTEYSKRTSKKTALAFVSNKEDGERDFLFYGSDAAHDSLEPQDISDIVFEKGDILHFCSVCLKNETSLYTHKLLLEKAIKKGAIISFDPNLRPSLWDCETKLIATVNKLLPYADIVKLSEDELVSLTNEKDEALAVRDIFNKAQRAKLLLVSLGANGACLFNRQGQKIHSPAIKVSCVDTTGAGDCFIASFLLKLPKNLNYPLEAFSQSLEYANKEASFIVTKKGAF